MQTVGNTVEVSVADDGPGMDADTAARVFDRFYRAEASRSRSSGGAGLGLSISESIVTAHGGTISVSSQSGVGTTFTVSLPLGPVPTAV